MAITLSSSTSATSNIGTSASTGTVSYNIGDFLIACVGTGNTTNTVSGAGLTWTKLGSFQSHITVWTATAASTSSGIISVSGGNGGLLLTASVFSGAFAIGANNNAAALTVNVTTTANNSWVWCFTYSLTGGSATATAGAGQTIQVQFDDSTASNFGAVLSKQNATTPTSGTVVTSNMTSTANSTKGIVAFEILPAVASLAYGSFLMNMM